MAKRLKKDGTEYADKVVRIALSKKKYLCKDACQMWIAKQKITKGEESFERISGYYTTFESLFDGYVREQGKKISGDDVAEHFAELSKLEKKLRGMAKTLGKELDNREID